MNLCEKCLCLWEIRGNEKGERTVVSFKFSFQSTCSTAPTKHCARLGRRMVAYPDQKCLAAPLPFLSLQLTRCQTLIFFLLY